MRLPRAGLLVRSTQRVTTSALQGGCSGEQPPSTESRNRPCHPAFASHTTRRVTYDCSDLETRTGICGRVCKLVPDGDHRAGADSDELQRQRPARLNQRHRGRFQHLAHHSQHRAGRLFARRRRAGHAWRETRPALRRAASLPDRRGGPRHRHGDDGFRGGPADDHAGAVRGGRGGGAAGAGAGRHDRRPLPGQTTVAGHRLFAVRAGYRGGDRFSGRGRAGDRVWLALQLYPDLRHCRRCTASQLPAEERARRSDHQN